MNEQPRKLSSLVTSVEVPTQVREVNGKVTKMPIRNQASIFGFFVDSLIRSSASDIYILSSSVDSQVIDALPQFMKSRLSLGDQNKKILQQVNNLILPLHEELGALWTERRMKNPEAHEHGLCILRKSLHSLAAAIKYNSQVDLDFNLVKNAISRIRGQVTAAESIAILSRIEGIANAYSDSTTLDSLLFKSTTDVSPGELLIELLEDAEYIELSKARYLLGIPATAKKSIIDIKRFVRSIIRNKQRQKNLAIAKQMVNIATDTLSIPFKIPEMPAMAVSFIPPIVNLDELRTPCMRYGDTEYPSYD